MYKKYLVTVFAWLFTLQVMAQYDLYVSVFEGGTLRETVELIADDAMQTVGSMKVNGPINGTDMMFIREMCGVKDLDTPTGGKVKVLDLSDANIVASSDVYLSMYGVDFTTQEDHFGSGFLYNCTQLEQVLIPIGIVSIDTLALGMCSSLKEVMIPNGVERIGYGAFYGCSSIRSIDVPDLVSVIEDGAFQNMEALEELSLGNAVTSLDNSAIMGDNRLQGITLGEGFWHFSPVLFYNSPSLANINVIPGNPYYSSWEGVLFSSGRDSLLAYPPAYQASEYELPEGVRHISPYAFCMSSELQTVIIPSSVEVIDTLAFYGSQSLADVRLNEGLRTLRFGAFANMMAEESPLTTLSLPSTVDEIEGGAFLFQTAHIRVSEQNEHYMTDEAGVLYNKAGSVLCHVPCTLHQAELTAVTDSVAPYAFAGSSMPTIYLGDGVKSVGNGAFFSAGAYHLTLGRGIERLGDRLVEGCSNLKSLCCFATPDDAHVAPAAFCDKEGDVARECVLYVLPGKMSDFMQKRGFSDAEGKSYFSAIREMEDADHLETVRNDALPNRPAYDWTGKRVSASHQGGRIVVLPDGKGIKVVGK